MFSRFLKNKSALLLIAPSLFALAACESSGTTRIAGIGSGGVQVLEPDDGSNGGNGSNGGVGATGPAGAQGPSGPAGPSGTFGLGSVGALAVGGLVGPGGVAGTGLLASTGDISKTNPIISGVLVKSGGLVNVVADKGLLLANAVDSKIPGSSNLVGTVVGVVKSTGVALVQTGNGQQYLVDGLAAAPGQLITATIGQATIVGAPNANPLIGASILSPTQQSGNLATVGVGTNGQLVTLRPGVMQGGLLGASPDGNPVSTLTSAVTGGSTATSPTGGTAAGTGKVVTGVKNTVTGVVGGLTGKLGGKGN